MIRHKKINLLPKEALALYHRRRRMTISGRIIGGLGVLALITSVFTGSAALYLKVITDADAIRLEVLSGSEELKRAGKLEALIGGFSQELIVLRDLQVKQYDPSFLVRDIVNVLPANAHIMRLKLDFEEDPIAVMMGMSDPDTNAPRLSLRGIADTRADILAFQHALEAFDFVDVVEAPTENIIYPTNANFAFELTLVPAAIAEKVKIEASENADAEAIEAAEKATAEAAAEAAVAAEDEEEEL